MPRPDYVSRNIQCNSCGRTYLYAGNRKGGHTATRCNSCVTYVLRLTRKKRMIEYKGGACEDCEFSEPIPPAYCFHHRDPKLKAFGLSGSHYRPWKKVVEELDKCKLLCVRCHAIEHFKRPAHLI